jgi:hypothetical protein
MMQQALQQPLQSPNQMTDFIISNLLITKIGDVVNKDFKLSFSNIASLCAFLSLNEIKVHINKIFEYFINIIKEMPNILISVALLFSKYFKKQQEEIITITEQKTFNTIDIEMESNYMLILCEYILQSENCIYNETIDLAIMKNINDTTLNKKLIQ